jgi:hypothetical protein
MRKRVGQAPTASEQTQQKPCWTSSNIGAELENHTVRQGPMWDRKGLTSVIKNKLMRLCVQFMDPSTDYLLPEHNSEGPLSRGQ